MATQRFQLVMRTGPTPGKIFELNKTELVIGRDASNDIVINDPEISRKHTRISIQSGGYVLEDLGSTNGTFANGQRLLGPHMLRPGETIMLGENISLSFEAAYDVNATAVSAPVVPPTYAPPPRQPAPQPPRPMPQPAYAGQIPPGPAEQYYAEPAALDKKKNNTLIFAGCGCLLIVLCFLVGVVAFDAMNMYCVGPFSIFGPIYEMLGGVACP